MEEDAEFIELMNVDPSDSIDLSLAIFEGIDYTFPLGVSLAAGERILIVKSPTGFAAAYQTVGMNLAPGDYASSLSNDGEEIALINGLGVDVQRFTYNDVSPWPLASDGDGYTLTLIAPETSPDHALPASWRISAFPGGSPGESDAEVFTGSPLADTDGDGLDAFLEYALGSIAGDSGNSPESYPQVATGLFDDGAGVFSDYLTISFRRNLSADDVAIIVQHSTDLLGWTDLGTEFVTASPNGDGTETVSFRSLTPLTGEVREFLRLKVVGR